MSPHGPDANTFDKASSADLSKADYLRGTMAFMFETRKVIRPSPQALQSGSLQANYDAVWDGLEKHFSTEQKA
jgi:homogentisate 1,2-dioxygenase